MTFTKRLTPYPAKLVLRLHLTDKAAKKNVPEADLATTALMSDGSIRVDIDMSPSRRSMPRLCSTSIHEAVHVCQFTEQIVETRFDQETAAYFIQSISSWMASKIAKALKRSR